MRSQLKPPAAPAPKTLMKSVYGTVSVYTPRHIRGCQLKARSDNRCSCPKWIYSKPREGKPLQQSAKTPSFTEALDVARKIFKGLDPEIRAAREILTPTAGLSIADAVQRYMEMIRGRRVTKKYADDIEQMLGRRSPRPATARGPGRAILNLGLLDYIDVHNRTARTPVVGIDKIMSDLINRWALGWKTNDLTSNLWRSHARSFFTWALARGYLKQLPIFDKAPEVAAGNRCGYFTDHQYQRIEKAIPFFRMRAHPAGNLAARMLAFVELGRWAGMALTDIVNFRPGAIDRDNVLSYQRRKNRKKKNARNAVILMDAARAVRLRSIPPEPDSDPEQPFLFPAIGADKSKELWRYRFQQLCEFAGITEIETELGVRRRPHPHMLRDTFAIDAISRGANIRSVSRMMGHANSLITERVYLMWVEKVDRHCIEDQRAALARVQAPDDLVEVSEDVGVVIQ